MADSMIDVQLRRRHVLIPRLVACVQAAATHEGSTHEQVAAARTGAGKDETARDQGRVLKQMFALAEAYPDLKTSDNFMKLQADLVDTEDRIALAREFFNGAVTAYNNRLESMPDVLLAKLGSFRKSDYFQVDGFERSPVTLSL